MKVIDCTKRAGGIVLVSLDNPEKIIMKNGHPVTVLNSDAEALLNGKHGKYGEEYKDYAGKGTL